MLMRLLRMAERDGSRCAGLVILTSTVFGVGLIRLLRQGLHLAPQQSMQVLVVATLHLVGPMVVSLIAFTRLTPLWLRRGREGGARVGWLTLGPAILVGPLLLIHALCAALVGGLLGGPGVELDPSLPRLIGAIGPLDVLAALARTALYLAGAALLCLWEARSHPLGPAAAEDLIASLIAREIALMVALKLIWTLAIDPVSLPTISF